MPELSPDPRKEIPSKPPWDSTLAPSSSAEAPAQEPRPPGGAAGCDPAAATSCALPGAVRLAVEALRLMLMGAAVLFPALLRLWRERGRHHLPGDRLRPQLPSPLCHGGWMRHPVPTSVQVPPLPSSPPLGKDPELHSSPIPFLFPRSSFCWEHRPEQAVEAAPEENTTCLICLDPVGDRKSYHTMVCPACKHAWFHRGCIQVGGAVPSPPGHGRCSAAPGPHSCSLCLSCRDRLCALAFLASSAPPVETRSSFARKCSPWGSESPSGWCPSARLTRQEGLQALCHARACPSSPGPPLCRESGLQLHGGVGNRAGGERRAGCPASALCRGSRGSSVFLSPSDRHHGRTATHTQH